MCGGENEIDIVIAVFTVLAAIFTASIAAFTLALAILRYADQRSADLRKLHQTFWNEVPMSKVRRYLSCDRQYMETCEPALIKRRRLFELTERKKSPADDEFLTEDEYEVIENLDHFFNFFQRLVSLAERPTFREWIAKTEDKDRQLREKIKFWNELYFGWWIHRCRESDRELVEWYMGKFYRTIPKIGIDDFHQVDSIKEAAEATS